MPELDQAKTLKALQMSMLERVGVSMDIYDRWLGGGIPIEKGAAGPASTDQSRKNLGLEEDGEKEQVSQNKEKEQLGDNEIAIKGVIVVDEIADFYKAFFGADFVTAPKDIKKQMADMDGDILFRIDSYGGHVKAASVICQLMNEYDKGRINAVITGWAASAATLIMMQADSLEIAEFGEVMIHRSSSCACGNGKDLKKVGEYLMKNDQTYAKAYANKSGKDEKEMLKLMDAETWFSASEAVEIGLVDAVAKKKDREKMEGDEHGDKEKMAVEAVESKSFDFLNHLELT